ncbi:MAG: hypothetical protein IJX77_01040 [Ruminococcus sp.]|nr:hypothetical protein [Ruminococcus sp.]
MAPQVKQIADMLEMLPQQEQEFAFEFIKRLVKAWDPDYTKVTPQEAKELEEAENSGYIDADEIDWDNLDKMNLD